MSGSNRLGYLSELGILCGGQEQLVRNSGGMRTAYRVHPASLHSTNGLAFWVRYSRDFSPFILTPTYSNQFTCYVQFCSAFCENRGRERSSLPADSNPSDGEAVVRQMRRATRRRGVDRCLNAIRGGHNLRPLVSIRRAVTPPPRTPLRRSTLWFVLARRSRNPRSPRWTPRHSLDSLRPLREITERKVAETYDPRYSTK